MHFADNTREMAPYTCFAPPPSELGCYVFRWLPWRNVGHVRHFADGLGETQATWPPMHVSPACMAKPY